MFWTESEDIFPKTFLLNNQLAQHGDIELSGGMGGPKEKHFCHLCSYICSMGQLKSNQLIVSPELIELKGGNVDLQRKSRKTLFVKKQTQPILFFLENLF